MALEHARLQAEVQAQLEQVRASRSRIVEAGDAERRRLERDLHDGAQQRLVTLSLALAMARDRAAADPQLESLIESASKEAREALTELRELARGIHPAVLTETGLAGAIQALAERSPVPTTIITVPAGRFQAAIEATAYFVVSEALANVAKHAMAGSAEVTIREQPRRLVVQVSDDGAGAPGPRRDPGCGAWPTGWPRRAACCGWTARRGAGPAWKQTSHIRDSGPLRLPCLRRARLRQPVLAVADRASSVAPIGVQFVKYVLHLLSGTSRPARGAGYPHRNRRGFGGGRPPWLWPPGRSPERNRGHRCQQDNGQRNVRRHHVLHHALPQYWTAVAAVLPCRRTRPPGTYGRYE